MDQITEPSFYNTHPNTLAVNLLGCVLEYTYNQKQYYGTIVETEAYYNGDPATHTPELFNSKPGTAEFVKFMHHTIGGIISGLTDNGKHGAVLIRALETPNQNKRIAAGPAKLCNYLQLTASLSQKECIKQENPCKFDLTDKLSNLKLYACKYKPAITIVNTTRIGINKQNPGASYKLRWYIKESQSVSRY